MALDKKANPQTARKCAVCSACIKLSQGKYSPPILCLQASIEVLKLQQHFMLAVLYERTGGVDEQRLKHLAQPKHSADYGPPSDAPNTLSGASHVCVRNAVSSPDPLIPSMRPLGSDLSMLEGEGSASLALQEARSRKALHSEHGALGLPFGAGTQAKKPTVAARKGA
eukprot:scaffold240305_cov19-Tisochrysis_lutea.AAC.2